MSQDTTPSARPARVKADLDTVQEWIANCAPNLVIDPEGELYLDFAAWEERGASLRGEDHIRQLYDGVTLSGRQSCQLFSGFSGTGKSTELRRLRHRLEAGGYTVLLVDANDYHDLTHALTFEDLLLIATGAFGEATAKLLGKDGFRESYWQKIKSLLLSKIEVEELKLKLGAAGEVKVGVRYGDPFWVKLREVFIQFRDQVAEDCHQFVRECVARIERHERHTRGVVLIFDSLEKLKGTTIFEFREIMESVIRSFSKNPAYLHLPDCHVVYSIPPYVQVTRSDLLGHYSGSTLLPAVKVLERAEDLVPHRPGIEAMSDLVGRRIPIEQVFGERRDLLEHLVIYSGGHVRTLVTFIRDLLFRTARAGFPPSDDEVERVVQRHRERTFVWRESVALLEKIRRTGSLEDIAEEEFPFLAQYMDTYVVLCYRNGDGWYEVHPLVRDRVARLARKHAAERAAKEAEKQAAEKDEAQAEES